MPHIVVAYADATADHQVSIDAEAVQLVIEVVPPGNKTMDRYNSRRIQERRGCFSYGGSSIALVFEQGIVDEFTVPFNNAHEHPHDGPTVFGPVARSQIARAA